MRNRLPNYLAERGMTRERYMALKWMCRGYDAMQRKLDEMRTPQMVARYGHFAGGGGKHGDSTSETAQRVADSKEAKIVGAIEKAALLEGGEYHQEIISCVCRGVGFEQMNPRPQCGEREFRFRVWAFFERLDELV